MSIEEYRPNKEVTKRMNAILSDTVGEFLRQRGDVPGEKASAARAMLINAAALLANVCGRTDEPFVRRVYNIMWQAGTEFCKENWRK